MRKNKSNISYLIKELEYARFIHKKAASLSMTIKEKQRHYRIIRQKNVLIEILKGNRLKQKSPERVVRRWIKIHRQWIDYLSYLKKYKLSKYEKEIKINGALSWHKRWIKIYQESLKSKDVDRKPETDS